jgi:hypothetical protein
MERIRVAFAGHNRLEDLGDISAVKVAVGRAFEMLKTVGRGQGELFTGLADGADVIAARTWADLGLGPIHAVYPFLDDEPGKGADTLADRVTRLDGAAIETSLRNPHLVQTRWLVEDADLLVVVWSGEAGRGAGGTADAVRVALERGVPVLWIKPGGGEALRLITPEALDPDFGFLEFLEQLQADRAPLVTPACEVGLTALLATLLKPAPEHIPSAPSVFSPLAALYDRFLDRTVWRTFAVYRRLMGGKPTGAHTATAIPESLAAHAGFQTLSQAYAAADKQAVRIAAVHRSQQVFQAAIMILAAAVGTAPAIWPAIKIYAVVTELILVLATFAVWFSAVHSERSRRWGEMRRLAEQLRLERAAWALGVSTRDDRRFSAGGAAARIAWGWRRRAGAPDGRYDAERLREWGGWAMDALILGQEDYHRVQGRLNARLSHRSHRVENTVFWLFLGLLMAFIGAYLGAERLRTELPHWVGGVVIVFGAVTPAFGAASLALESALSFADQSRRSDHLVRELAAIQANLTPDADLEALQRAARAAIRLQISQEERWGDDAAHRHVVRGG